MLEFKDIINKHKGITARIIGLGPSLEQHLDDLRQKEDDIYFSCNAFDELIDLDIDYWVLANANPKFDILTNHKRYNDYGRAVVLYKSMKGREWENEVEKVLNVPFLTYSNRFPDEKKSIQWQFAKYTGNNKSYSSGATVAIHMLAFAIIMGCNPIYIYGVDLDYITNGAYVNKLDHKVVNPDGTPNPTSYMEIYLSEILYSFRVIKEAVPDIIIINKSTKNLGAIFD